MRTTRLLVISEEGLHARPADLFVKMANKFSCSIQIKNQTSGVGFVDAKSILRVLSLGVYNNHTIEIRSNGDDEMEAIKSLSDLVNRNFTD